MVHENHGGREHRGSWRLRSPTITGSSGTREKTPIGQPQGRSRHGKSSQTIAVPAGFCTSSPLWPQGGSFEARRERD